MTRTVGNHMNKLRTSMVVAMGLLSAATTGCRTASLLPANPPTEQCYIQIHWYPINGGGDVTPAEPDAKFWTVTAFVSGSDPHDPGTVTINMRTGRDEIDFDKEPAITLSGSHGAQACRDIYSSVKSALQEYRMLGDTDDPKGRLTILITTVYDEAEIKIPVTESRSRSPAFRRLLDLLNTYLSREFQMN